MRTLKVALLVGFFIFLAFGILYPNPYGNNPDIIGDESYFLSTALFSIEKPTLPGWEFSPSGAYYGGPQTYIDTAVLIPVLGAVVAASDFSLTTAKLWIALNTGELLHILRLVNGIAALGTLLFFFFYFKKRNIPLQLVFILTLFLFFLLSNVIILEFLHTAKMWVFYILFVAAASALFIAQEYYLSRFNAPFIEKNRYVAFWVWSGVLTFFQSWVGVFSIALLMLYALVLRHISIRDLWDYLLKYWYLVILFSLTQVGFAYRLYSILDIFSGITTRTAEGVVDWSARLLKPLVFSLQTQPLVVFYILAALVIAVLAIYYQPRLADPRKRMWISIALVHPLLVYLIFHVGIGFDAGPRYAIFLTMAASFSAAILLSEIGTRAMTIALLSSAILFVVVNVHAIQLYWRPSSETVLLQTIMEKNNTADNVFIVDHSAKRMTLPVNYKSLPLQGEIKLAMGRFQFLLENRESLPKEGPFKPLAFTAYTKEEEDAYIERFKETHAVWMIRRSCDVRCSTTDREAGSCFELHLEACVVSPQDTNALPEFLSSQQLGNSYIVRRINPVR